jgi:hypothetical protein
MRYFQQPFEFIFKGGHLLIWLLDLAVLILLVNKASIGKDAVRPP